MPYVSDEPIGIIGAGRLGQALARSARRAGRPVTISNSRGPESLSGVIASFDGGGVTAAATRDAACCPIVARAVPWVSVKDAVSELSWTRQILIDATNAVLLPSLEAVPLGDSTSSEIAKKSGWLRTYSLGTTRWCATPRRRRQSSADPRA